MARQADFVDPEYDRKLAEYKEMKRRERQQQEQSNSSQ
jgi:hypothetical protein